MAQEMEGQETIKTHPQETKTTGGGVIVVKDEEVEAGHPVTIHTNC